MEVRVNGVAVNLPAGMTVRHALVGAGLLQEVELGRRVYDRWGNELGLDGVLAEGEEIFVR